MPFIDENANMHLHAREGGIAVFDFEDDDGNPRDMTGASIFFEVEGFRKALDAGETSSQMLLIIDRGELNDFINKKREYVVLDETGVVPHVIVEGNLIVNGWE